MKISMTPAGDGVAKVQLEKDGRVYSFDGYITDFEMNYDRDYDDYDFGRILKRQGYTVTVTLSAGAIQMLDPTAYLQAKAAELAAYPQRYVLGMDQPEEEVLVEVPPVVEVTPADIPSDWIDLDGA